VTTTSPVPGVGGRRGWTGSSDGQGVRGVSSMRGTIQNG
jgi:hypothetical protein